MMAIVISACLVSDPGVCKDYRIPLASGIDATHCMAEAHLLSSIMKLELG